MHSRSGEYTPWAMCLNRCRYWLQINTYECKYLKMALHISRSELVREELPTELIASKFAPIYVCDTLGVVMRF